MFFSLVAPFNFIVVKFFDTKVKIIRMSNLDRTKYKKQSKTGGLLMISWVIMKERREGLMGSHPTISMHTV